MSSRRESCDLLATNRLLAVVVFGALTSAAYNYIWVHLAASPAMKVLAPWCPPNYYNGGGRTISNPVSVGHLYFTGATYVDSALCGLVNFFNELLNREPNAVASTAWLLWSIPSVAFFPIVESVRNNRPFVLGFPTLAGFLYQNISGGVILPIYFVLFILSGAHSKRSRTVSKTVERDSAIPILFALIAGYIPLTWYTINSRSPLAITAWQFFPIIISIVQFTVGALRKTQKSGSQSGTRIVQLIYGICFIISTITHISVVSNRIFDKEALIEVFLPSPTPIQLLEPAPVAHNIIKWDSVFVFSTTAIGSLWFANGICEAFDLALLNVFLGLLFGPGSAFALILIWRENSMATGRKTR